MSVELAKVSDQIDKVKEEEKVALLHAANHHWNGTLATSALTNVSAICAAEHAIPKQLYPDNPAYRHDLYGKSANTESLKLFAGLGVVFSVFGITSSWQDLKRFMKNKKKREFDDYLEAAIAFFKLVGCGFALLASVGFLIGGGALVLTHIAPFILAAVAGAMVLYHMYHFFKNIYFAIKFRENTEKCLQHVKKAMLHLVSAVINVLYVIFFVSFLLPAFKKLADLVAPSNLINMLKDFNILKTVGQCCTNGKAMLLTAMAALTAFTAAFGLKQATKDAWHEAKEFVASPKDYIVNGGKHYFQTKIDEIKDFVKTKHPVTVGLLAIPYIIFETLTAITKLAFSLVSIITLGIPALISEQCDKHGLFKSGSNKSTTTEKSTMQPVSKPRLITS